MSRFIRLQDCEDELEKFVMAMGLVSTLHPTMVIDVEDPVSMAEQIVDYVTKEIDD